MIFQGVLDFLRDAVLGLLRWVDSLTTGLDFRAAGAALGGVAAQAGHFLALFIAPGVWPTLITTWTVFLGVWAVTAFIAMIARRGTSS